MDQNGCFIYFTYFYDDDGTLRVEVQKEPGMFHIPPPQLLFIVRLFQLINAYLCRLVINTHTFCNSISFQEMKM